MNIENIVKILSNGKIICIPTDTVYGLVCDATNEEAVKKIYDIKKRPYSKPLVILVSDIKMLKKCVKEIRPIELDLIEKFLPGPLTIIFKKSDFIPDIVSANLDEIAIRIPDNKELQEIIKKLNKPVVATSANLSNKETITSIKMLDSSIKENLSYIYDGGVINNEPSTLIKIVDDRVVILRKGALSNDIENTFI